VPRRLARDAKLRDLVPTCENAVAIRLGCVSMKKLFEVLARIRS
jgi:hypothetical protein